MPRPRIVGSAFGLILITAAFLSPPLQAGDEPACPEPLPRRSAGAKPPDTTPELPTQIYAREMRTHEGISTFTGAVELQRGGQTLTAERVQHDRNTEELQASGQIKFHDASGFSYRTDELQINLETRRGHAGPGSFTLEGASARGDAERVDFEGPDHTRLTRLRYTTCAPGKDDWYLKVRRLKLDTEENVGTAYHAVVDFHGVPLFYLPHLSFPLSDERKSGFLIPRAGSSGSGGTELSTPYYFNIAPHLDDTLTPHYFSKRGLQLHNEFRYLTPRSEGKLDLEGLANDRQRNRDDRAAGAYLHRHVFNPYWSANVDVRGVSDKQYLEDFGDSFGITSQTHLPQNARVDYRGLLWNFSLRAADYQTIDPTIAPADKPYARLPQIDLSLNRPVQPNRVHFGFETEAVQFERDTGVTGTRVNLYPSVSLPLSNSYGFFTPRVGVRHLVYSLSGAAEDSPAVTRGVFSLDGGLVFERDSRWGGRNYLQTLEPRLFYLLVPTKKQDTLPNFDTALPEFTFSNLFRDNRFAGGDRIGDANQLTAAVTTRFIDEEDGSERARASLGRIYYFSDREVNVPAGTIDTAASDVVGEAAVTLASHWHARSGVQWNRSHPRLEKYSLYLQYNPARDRILNVGKRFIRDQLEQTDVSTEWPVATRWTFRARSLYSHRDGRNVESYLGMEYNACCWALRVVARRLLRVDSATNAATQDNAVLFELELTGLSRLGRVPDSPLRESVFSFPSRRDTAAAPLSP